MPPLFRFSFERQLVVRNFLAHPVLGTPPRHARISNRVAGGNMPVDWPRASVLASGHIEGAKVSCLMAYLAEALVPKLRGPC